MHYTRSILLFALFYMANAQDSAQCTAPGCATDETMPAFYISHGGGPCFFMETKEFPLSAMDKNSDVAKWYRDFAARYVPTKPTAILVVSAHWEESVVHIQSKPHPRLYFDYYGFPPHTYELTYPAPGDPKLAQRVRPRNRKRKRNDRKNGRRIKRLKFLRFKACSKKPTFQQNLIAHVTTIMEFSFR